MKSDEQFEKDLENSHKAILAVVDWFERRRVSGVLAPKPEVHPNPKEYIDLGDLMIPCRGEVKWVSQTWTCADDCTFDNLIVDETRKVNKLRDKVNIWGYIICNIYLSHAALIPFSTEPHWYDQSRFDKVYMRNIMFTFCPKQYATFIELGV